MLAMTDDDGAVITGTTTSRSFRVSKVCVVEFCVTGLSGGSITIEYKPSGSSTWITVDATALVFSADGIAYAILGGGHVRASSSSATTGTTLYVGLTGDFVHEN